MIRFSSFAIVLALCAAPLLAQGQSTSPCHTCPDVTGQGVSPTFIPKVFQGSNTWFDPARSGEGWTFSELIGPPAIGNVGLAVTYTYETDGKPSWLLLQGGWTREQDMLALFQGMPIAKLDAAVFDGQDGTCPTCPWAEASIAQRRYQQGQVLFHRPDVATVTLDGETALSGAGVLIPTELSVTRPLPGYFEGRWRFTRRIRLGNQPGTYTERNYETHRCQTVATQVSSPTEQHRFDPKPGQNPFYVPPSGSHVQWVAFDINFECVQGGPGQEGRWVIAYNPQGSGPIRGISLTTLTAITRSTGGTFPQTIVERYEVPETAYWFEVYVQDLNTMIIRRQSKNKWSGTLPNGLPGIEGSNSTIEMLLSRAPE